MKTNHFFRYFLVLGCIVLPSNNSLLAASMILDINTGDLDKFVINGVVDNPKEGVYQSNLVKYLDDYTIEGKLEISIKPPACGYNDYEFKNCSMCSSGKQSCDVVLKAGSKCEEVSTKPPQIMACNGDSDFDGIVDQLDNCYLVANPDQINIDGDSLGDACDQDDDNDGVLDQNDNCPKVSNASQLNNDIDSEGDVCDSDDDNDRVLDQNDNCPLISNPDQLDTDKDGKGDRCDFQAVFADSRPLEEELDDIHELEDELSDDEEVETEDEPLDVEEMLYELAESLDNCHAGNTIAPAFRDISGHWAENYIQVIHDLGIVHGKSEGVYAPDDYLTRAELTKIVLNAFCISVEGYGKTAPFPDVQPAVWFTPFIDKAKELQVVQGYQDGKFYPDRSVSRAESVKMILTTADMPIKNVDSSSFNDLNGQDWYDEVVNYAASLGIVQGYSDGTFKADRQITRAEMAKIIVKSMEVRE